MVPSQPVKPRKLNTGDTICVVAPGSATIDGASLERGKSLLQERGFRVIEGMCSRETRLLFAGEDRARADDINGAFADDSIDAIMCVRGGAGTARILPYIDFRMIRRKPKILIGYSDITVLQLAILARCSLVTFYGPMLATDVGRAFPRFSEQNLLRMLTTTDERIVVGKRGGKRVETLCPGEAYGQLIGGCLSVFVSTLGTEWEVDTQDKILFFEDVDERPHRIERYLTQLFFANKLQAAKAILFGALSRCEYPPRHEYAKFHVRTLDVIRDRIVPLGKPCLYGLPFGHTRNKLTIPTGGFAFVDATNQQVVFDPAVS